MLPQVNIQVFLYTGVSMPAMDFYAAASECSELFVCLSVCSNVVTSLQSIISNEMNWRLSSALETSGVFNPYYYLHPLLARFRLV